MIPELGQLALCVALCVAIAQAVFALAGAARRDAAWIAVARPAAFAQLLFVALAYGCLTYASVTNDFSVAYIAMNSNSALPLAYRIAAVWGGHEGSILLWALMLAAWTVAVAAASRSLPQLLAVRVLGVMGLVSIGFLAFTILTSNPFLRQLPAPPDGRDLNPLLQDPGMVLHPPMLYMGYVGFSVAFAFAISALLAGRLDAAWARWSRPWTTTAWLFLTLGIALGSYWAYYELGWGGWWFWDPVENASFMPWLVGTALIHSLAVTEKRGCFRAWTVLAAIFAFAFSLLGTFLVRSGVLTSVHAFATDPRRGIFILILLILAIGGSLALFAWRAPRIGVGGRFESVSRETALLANNVLLAVVTGSVMLGTLYPLILDALGLGKISVGAPYFETVFAPLMAPALFLMGVGPVARWKSVAMPELAVRLRWALGASVAAGLLLPVVLGRSSPWVSLGLFLAAWIAFTSLMLLWRRLGPLKGYDGLRARLRGTTGSFYGMLLAHLGVAVFVAGVTLVKAYEGEKDVRVAPGDTAELSGYSFRFEGVDEVKGPNYVAARATVSVTRAGDPVTVLHPEKRVYHVQRKAMTEAAIDSGLTRDLYVALGEPVGSGGWLMRVYYKPFVSWIWGGCVLMALGGVLAVADRRYRGRAYAPVAAVAAGRTATAPT